MKIGLSVKHCVIDICRGNVKIEDVEKIIARTACENEEDWNQVIYLYKRDYWGDFPDKAGEIIRQFIAENKIEQPRLNGRSFADIKSGIWVESEKEIKWI